MEKAKKKMGRPTDNPKNHRLAVRVDDETLTRLNEVSEKSGLSKTELVRRGIALVLEEFRGL